MPTLFALDEADGPLPAERIRFRFFSGDPPAESRVLDQEICRSRHIIVWRTPTGFHLRCGASSLGVDPARAEAVGRLLPEFWTLPLADRREFFLLSLLMLLRPLGRFGLHGNGVAQDGRGFLIVSDAECGKTTLTLALIREGWSLVADDALVVCLAEDGLIEARALRRGVSCTRETQTRFPEFDIGSKEDLGSPKEKWLVDLEEVHPGRTIPDCRPTTLLFPRIERVPSSRLEPLDPIQSMLSLIQESPGILAGGKESGEQTSVLERLVRQCRAYRLTLGRDLLESPSRVARMLSGG